MNSFIAFQSALRRLLQPIILSVLTLGLMGCSLSDEHAFHLINGPTMGTWYNIKYQLPNETEITETALQSKVERVLNDVNQKMSTYVSDSELSEFNRAAVGKGFSLSTETVEVLRISKEVHRVSRGAFDPTVGPLVNLWGFGPEKKPDEIPSAAEIANALSLVGVEAISLTDKSATKRAPRSIDLSAVAKGYAVDKLAELMISEGIVRFMVEVGGEIRVGEKKMSGDSWQIAIEEPSTLGRSVQKVVSISNVGLATSGDYRNYFEKDGKRYSHTIDPATGYPIQHRLASVTVIHKSCAYADAFATALSVLGPDKGFELAVELDLAVYMLVKKPGDDSGFEVLQTESFAPYVDQSAI